MKLCRNCRTVNPDDAIRCMRCKIQDHLVDYNPEITKDWQKSMHEKNNVKQMHNICRNCGTTDHGNNKKCVKCHFPFPAKAPKTTNQGESQSHMIK